MQKSDVKVHQSWLRKPRSFTVQSAMLFTTLGWAILWSMYFTRTVYSHSLKTNGPAITIAIDLYHEYSLKENWTMNTVAYEMNNWRMKWTILLTFSK